MENLRTHPAAATLSPPERSGAGREQEQRIGGWRDWFSRQATTAERAPQPLPHGTACEHALAALSEETLSVLRSRQDVRQRLHAIGARDVRLAERMRMGTDGHDGLRKRIDRDIAAVRQDAHGGLLSLLEQHAAVHRNMDRRDRGTPEALLRDSGLVALLPLFADGDPGQALRRPELLGPLQELRTAMEANARDADRLARGAFLLHGYRGRTAFNPDVDAMEEEFHRQRQALMAQYAGIAERSDALPRLAPDAPPCILAVAAGTAAACRGEADAWNGFNLFRDVPFWNGTGNILDDYEPPRWITAVPVKRAAWEAYWGKREARTDNPSIPSQPLGRIDPHAARIFACGDTLG